MTSAVRKFDSTFVGKDWYDNSLSRILDRYARDNKNSLPTGIHLVVYDAAISVYSHESRIHMWLQGTGVDEQVHPDLDFVQDGYKTALGPLMKLMKAPEPQASNPHITKVRNDLLQLLEIKFTCLEIDNAYRKGCF